MLARAISNGTEWDAPDKAAAAETRIRELVDRLVRLAPDSSYANGWLAYFSEQEGNLHAAALYREQAVAGATDSNLYLQLGIAARFLTRLGRLEEAAALSRFVVNRDPACTPCVDLLA